MNIIEGLKTRSETEWIAPLNLMEGGYALANCLKRTIGNIKADLSRCKETMSPGDYVACLEYVLNDFIPRRVTG